MHYLLSLLIFTPLMAAVVALTLPSAQQSLFRIIALAASGFQCLLLFLIIQSYQVDLPGFQLVEKVSWITIDFGSWGIFKAEYFVGLDGLSMTLVLLSVIILLLAVIASWTIPKNGKGYFILLLILNGSIIGSFCALDLLLFYVFFEFMLLPMYFLIGIWGGPQREYASMKFFLFTLLGSILILIVIIGLYLSVKDPSDPERLVHSFNMLYMADPSNVIKGSVLDPHSNWMIGLYTARRWSFLLLLAGFGIKLPIVPLHTWLPDAHVEAPTAVSVILAALLLKIGAYGLLRVAYPIFPQEAIQASWLVGILGVISILYGALNALASKDLKRLIAYSSISHMGFVLLGIASGTIEGVTGSIYQLFSHGLISAMLFILAGVLQDRTQDRKIENYSGLVTRMKAYTAFIMVAFFASMGLPGFSGFIAEVMIFFGAFKSHFVNDLLPAWMAVISTLGLFLGAAYYLWTIQRMFLGPFAVKLPEVSLSDLSGREYVLLLPLALLALGGGIFPQPLLDVIHPFAQNLLDVVMKIKPR